MKNFPSTASVSRREFLRASAGTGFLPLAQSAAGQSSIGRKLGVALCGLGNYARGQLGPALKLTQNCELRGVVTGSPEKGGAWAKEYGFPQKNIYHYDTMARLVENLDIDIVHGAFLFATDFRAGRSTCSGPRTPLAAYSHPRRPTEASRIHRSRPASRHLASRTSMAISS
jgi:hypothetical protein